MLFFGQWNAVCGYVLLLILITPLGALKLGETSYSRAVWMGKLLTAQISHLILFFASVTAFLGLGPQLLSPEIPLSLAMHTLQEYTLKQWGIFPWGVYGLWAVILGYIAYAKKSGSHFYQIALQLCPKKCEGLLKQIITFTCSGSKVMAISFTLGSSILLFTYFIQTRLFHYAMSLPVLIVLSLYFAMLFCGFSWGKRLFKHIVRKGWSLPLLIICLTVLLTGLFLLAAYANQWVLARHPQLMNSLVCHQCAMFFTQFPPEMRWAAFYLGWWLMWTPLAGSYLLKISQGLSVREFILGLFALPSIILTVLVLKPETMTEMVTLLPLLNTPWVLLLLGCGSLFILCRLLSHVKSVDWFYCGDFTFASDETKTRQWLKDGVKSHGFIQFYQRIGISTIVILLIHTLAGWYGIQFQMSVIGCIVTAVIFLGFSFFMMQLIRDKILARAQKIPELS